jgi:hypothetical protein
MQFQRLDNENYALYAAKHYDNPTCRSVDEFNEDLTRLIYLKRLFKRYKRSGELRERLILNHLITFYNVFGNQAATRLLFFKIDHDLHGVLKTFLVYLQYMPENTKTIDGIDTDTIPLDQVIVDQLRKLG